MESHKIRDRQTGREYRQGDRDIQGACSCPRQELRHLFHPQHLIFLNTVHLYSHTIIISLSYRLHIFPLVFSMGGGEKPLVSSFISQSTIQVSVSLVAISRWIKNTIQNHCQAACDCLCGSPQMEQELARFLGLGSRASWPSTHIQDVHIVWDSLRRPSRKTLLERL